MTSGRLVNDTVNIISDDTFGNTDDAKDEERMEDDDLPTCMLWRQSKARVSLVSMQHLPHCDDAVGHPAHKEQSCCTYAAWKYGKQPNGISGPSNTAINTQVDLTSFFSDAASSFAKCRI